VIRDGQGNVLLTAWQLLRPCVTVEDAEAEACERAETHDGVEGGVVG
jgi:hypothetical protein